MDRRDQAEREVAGLTILSSGQRLEIGAELDRVKMNRLADVREQAIEHLVRAGRGLMACGQRDIDSIQALRDDGGGVELEFVAVEALHDVAVSREALVELRRNRSCPLEGGGGDGQLVCLGLKLG